MNSKQSTLILPPKKPFAEIIESSLQGWLAQCWEWNNFPQFGSLVTIKTKKGTIFGVVHQIETGSMDSTRHPFPYKKTEEQLLKEQPQIFEFLKTTFSCLTLGYKNEYKINYLLATQPPQIHSFVSLASPEESTEFFNNHQYLHLLFNNSHQIFNLDELLLAILKHQKEQKILTDEKIKKFFATFTLLTGNDYRRLKLFLQRFTPHIKNKGNSS